MCIYNYIYIYINMYMLYIYMLCIHTYIYILSDSICVYVYTQYYILHINKYKYIHMWAPDVFSGLLSSYSGLSLLVVSCLQPQAKLPKHKIPNLADLPYKRLDTKATHQKPMCIYIYVCMYIYVYVHVISGTQALSKAPNCNLFSPTAL